MPKFSKWKKFVSALCATVFCGSGVNTVRASSLIEKNSKSLKLLRDAEFDGSLIDTLKALDFILDDNRNVRKELKSVINAKRFSRWKKLSIDWLIDNYPDAFEEADLLVEKEGVAKRTSGYSKLDLHARQYFRENKDEFNEITGQQSNSRLRRYMDNNVEFKDRNSTVPLERWQKTAVDCVDDFIITDPEYRDVIKRLVAYDILFHKWKDRLLYLDRQWITVKFTAGVVGAATLFTSLVATIGLASKMAMDEINRKESQRKREAAQKSFDDIMKKTTGDSAINFDVSRKDIQEGLNKIKKMMPHNASEIDKIAKVIDGHLALPRNKRGALGISIDGPPGCGKTFFSIMLGKILGANTPVIVGKSDIDAGNKRVSVRQQFCDRWRVGDGENGYWAYGKFISALIHNTGRNKAPYIIVDELDKLPPEVLTALWNLQDYAKLNCQGGDIDVNGGIFVFPNNVGLLGKFSGGSNVAMTQESIASRFKGLTFHFKAPTVESYAVSIRKIISETARRVKDDYGVTLKYDEESIRNMADIYYSQKGDMRLVRNFSRELARRIDFACKFSGEKGLVLRFVCLKHDVDFRIVKPLIADKPIKKRSNSEYKKADKPTKKQSNSEYKKADKPTKKQSNSEYKKADKPTKKQSNSEYKKADKPTKKRSNSEYEKTVSN